MKPLTVRSLLALCGCLCGMLAQASTLPQELRASVPAAVLSGQATMSFWGIEIYAASLWVAPGFADSAYERSVFGLELVYLRDFKGADIAKRSIVEMQGQEVLHPELRARWETQMRALFPNVKAGDRISGVHQPDVGAVFWCNGRMLGEIRDADFSKRFFGIWLAPQTSQPQLRRALLARSTTSGVVPR